MRQRPAESDQLMIAIDGCIPPLARKLNDMGIRNFEDCIDLGYRKRVIWSKRRNTSEEDPETIRGHPIMSRSMLLIGLASSLIWGDLSLKFLINLLKKDSFTPYHHQKHHFLMPIQNFTTNTTKSSGMTMTNAPASNTISKTLLILKN